MNREQRRKLQKTQPQAQRVSPLGGFEWSDDFLPTDEDYLLNDERSNLTTLPIMTNIKGFEGFVGVEFIPDDIDDEQEKSEKDDSASD